MRVKLNKQTRPLLDFLLGHYSKVAVLRTLSRVKGTLNGHEVARRSNITPPTAHQALRELEELGVIEREVSGPVHLFRLAEENYAVREILLPMFDKERALLDALLDQLKQGAPHSVVSMVLFGSTVRGEAKGVSDIDLLVLLGKSKDKSRVQEFLDQRAGILWSEFRRHLAPIVWTVNTFRRRYHQKQSLAIRLTKEGLVFYGEPLSRMLSNGS